MFIIIGQRSLSLRALGSIRCASCSVRPTTSESEEKKDEKVEDKKAALPKLSKEELEKKLGETRV